MMVKRRAISQAQKEKRRQAILDAAGQLFEEMPYEKVGIVAVARKAGIAKGTVYLYFKTKEELFLALQARAFEGWFDEIDAHLQEIKAARGICTVEEVVVLMGSTLEKRQALIRLIAISNTILERNIDYPTALSFKQMLRARILQAGALLEACLPFLRLGQGAQLLLRGYALIVGIQHVAEPAPIVRKTLEEPGMAVFKVGFLDELTGTLRTLLYGYEYQSRRKHSES